MIPNNMMNNPLMSILQAGLSEGNIMPAMQQFAGNNPLAARAFNAIQGKNPQQLRQMAINMAKEKGVTVQQVAQQYGLKLPNR